MNEQFIVDKSGTPTAVILPIGDYKKMLSALEKTDSYRENASLFKLPEFKKLVGKGLEDVNSGRIRHWKEVWNEL